MTNLKDLGTDRKEKRLIKALNMGQTATAWIEQGMAGPCTYVSLEEECERSAHPTAFYYLCRKDDGGDH